MRKRSIESETPSDMSSEEGELRGRSPRITAKKETKKRRNQRQRKRAREEEEAAASRGSRERHS